MEQQEVGLSANELKKQLFASFRSTGILGSVKSQLRAALLQQLRSHDGTLLEAPFKGRPSLQDRLLNSLFLDYLEKTGYTFSQSIFVPESQMDLWPPFSYEEMLQILRLDMIAEIKASNRKACLVQQLLVSVQQCSNTKKEISTQTVESDPKTLYGCLREIDQSFHQKIENCAPTQSLEERMNIVYRDFDKKVQAEVDSQVKKIREFELEAVRMEDASRYRREIFTLRDQLEHAQRERAAGISQQEMLLFEKMMAKQKEVDYVAYQQRQRLLEETERLHAREEKFRIHLETQEKLLQQREESLREKELQVKLREEDTLHLREFLHSQTDELISMKRNELERGFQKIQDKLLNDRTLFEAEQKQLKDDKETFLSELNSARNDKELVEALYNRLSAEEVQKKALLVKINELEEDRIEFQRQTDATEMAIVRNPAAHTVSCNWSDLKALNHHPQTSNFFEQQAENLRKKLDAKEEELVAYKKGREESTAQHKQLIDNLHEHQKTAQQALKENNALRQSKEISECHLKVTKAELTKAKKRLVQTKEAWSQEKLEIHSFNLQPNNRLLEKSENATRKCQNESDEEDQNASDGPLPLTITEEDDSCSSDDDSSSG